MFGYAKLTEALEEIAKRLDTVEALLAGEVTWKTVADRLAEENKELRDRFMARNYQDYATMRAADGDSIEVLKPPKPQPEPGEIISDG